MRTVLVLVLAGTLAGLLLAEGAARLAERFRCREVLAGFTVRNRFYGWGNRPGARGWQQRCVRNDSQWRVHTRINSRGLRGAEAPYARTGAFRILVLGDSFTAALQVDEERTYPRLLEKRLDAGAPPGVRFEVLNAGVLAWGTDNELLFYRHEGWKYGADLVLLAFDTSNDVFENTRELVSVSPFWGDKPYFALADGRLALEHYPLSPQPRREAALRRAIGMLTRESALFRLATSNVPLARYLMLPPPPRPPDRGPIDTSQVYLATYPEAWRAAWRITRGLVLLLRREVEAHGSRFAVAVINAREEVSRPRWELLRALSPSVRGAACDVDKPNRLITQFLARKGIAAIPLLDAFRAEFGADSTPGFFPGDMHWAAAGHELAAREIARGLVRLGLVPARDAPAAEVAPGKPSG